MKDKKNRSFVRGLWGVYDNTRRFFKRRSKMDDDINMVQRNRYEKSFVTYVFGDDNYKYLVDQGFKCKLVDKKPILWDMNTQQFRHKLEILKQGMQDFNEIVFLDWDCMPIKEIPKDFWDVLGKKAPLQAILRMYHRRKATWRKTDQRKIPCASFVYVGDKQIANDLTDLWEKMKKPWSEEVVLGKYMDNSIGGWQGLDKYWELFEPDFFVLRQGKVFSKELLSSKFHCFDHFSMKERKAVLDATGKGKKPEWLI